MIFTDGTKGFIVPIRDRGAVAHYLQAFADNLDLRFRMSERHFNE
jgi:hypothetical protein